MKTFLTFDFEVDKVKNQIFVKREFAASLPLVWAAWTTAELLDQWWAPRPYQTITKSMDFRNGGRWHYAMKGPEGDTHWCLADYSDVENQKCFSHLDAFCDENQTMTTEMPRTQWKTAFSEKKENTLVSVTLQYDSLENLEKIIELGFKEGFTMAMGNLDELLENIKQ